jgi:hypothetical protein
LIGYQDTPKEDIVLHKSLNIQRRNEQVRPAVRTKNPDHFFLPGGAFFFVAGPFFLACFSGLRLIWDEEGGTGAGDGVGAGLK